MQLQGQGLAQVPKRISRPTSPAQKRLLEALDAPLITDFTAQFQRKAKMIAIIEAYCGIEEPNSMPVLEGREAPPPPELLRPNSPEFRRSVIASSVDQKLNRCFLCVAKALTFPPDDVNIAANTTAPVKRLGASCKCAWHI
ncbi:hypothetical protein F4782DRAFT_551827 [Xylaria castorea]|nr:hypothetical protein F4782DRAFT_551827 [Xylaria castorea]